GARSAPGGPPGGSRRPGRRRWRRPRGPREWPAADGGVAVPRFTDRPRPRWTGPMPCHRDFPAGVAPGGWFPGATGGSGGVGGGRWLWGGAVAVAGARGPCRAGQAPVRRSLSAQQGVCHSAGLFLRCAGEPRVKVMFAVYAARIDRDQPLAGLELGERPASEARPGWSTVTVKAASLNHHDLWSLRGVGLTDDKLPMILGCDAAGIDEDGNEVVLHSVIGQTGHGVGPEEPRSILTERYQGTFAEQVAVPTWNVLPKPKELSFEEAACLPTAWLTAYRMLFTNAGVRPGDSV